MSDNTENTTTPAVIPKREIRVVQDEGALSYLYDTARFEHMFRIAAAMAAASLIPDHLRGIKRGGNFDLFTPEEIKANCFLVVNQSLRWGMDPFAVAPETYVVGGKLAYQGKLVAAVVNSRAGLEGRLSYSFTGQKGNDNFTITVSGKFVNDATPREITLSVGDGKTDNSMWRKDPEQKLVYSGVVKWARRYCPEVVLGVVTDDDIDRINESGARAANATEVKPIFPALESGESVPKAPRRRPAASDSTPAFESTTPANTGTQVEPEEDLIPATPQQSLDKKILQAGIPEAALMKYLRDHKYTDSQLITQLIDDEVAAILTKWDEFKAALA